MADMETRGAELLPCPFCGHAAIAIRSTSTDWYGHWMVACGAEDDSCAVDPYLMGGRGDADREPAIARWNRRSPLPQPPEAEK